MDEERLYNNNVNSEEKEYILKADAEAAVADNGDGAAVASEQRMPTGDDNNNDELGLTVEGKRRRAEQKKKQKRVKRGEPEPDTDRDRLICAIASCVALAAAILFAVLLALSLGNMADMLRGLRDAALWIGAIANLMLTFGLGIGSIVLSAMAYTFARRAHRGAPKRWREPTFILMLLPAFVAFGAAVMLVVSIAFVI